MERLAAKRKTRHMNLILTLKNNIKRKHIEKREDESTLKIDNKTYFKDQLV